MTVGSLLTRHLDVLFFESRAIVLSAMGNHKQALQIYIYQLHDYQKAEDYCNRIYLQEQVTATTSPTPNTPGTPSVLSPSATSGVGKRLGYTSAVTTREKDFVPYDAGDAPPNIYTTLLSLYLRPPPPQKEVLWPPALELLSKHGARLPASATLDLLPADLLIGELEAYFRGRMRNTNSVRNEERIVKGLEGVRKVELERQLLLGSEGKPGGAKGRNRRVVIREEDHCKVCHKRFGNSAVRVYPDNEVIHYGCVGRSGVKRMGTGVGGPGATVGEFEGMRRVPWG